VFGNFVITLIYRISEEFEGTKGVTRSVNRRWIDKTIVKRKSTNNDVQNTTQKLLIKD